MLDKAGVLWVQLFLAAVRSSISLPSMASYITLLQAGPLLRASCDRCSPRSCCGPEVGQEY